MILVYRYRVKSLTGLLNRQARAVNFVWNYCNDRQKDALRFGRRWHTGFDLNKLTTGSSRELGLHSGTVNAVCEQYAKSRSQKKRPYLRYRGRKTLAWVPIKGRELKREGNAFRFAGNTFRVFYSRPLPDGKIKDGSNFSRDRRGNWFLNIAIEVAVPQARPPVRAVAQRARKAKRVKAIHAQIAHCRSDFLHKLSARIVRDFDCIVVGNVNAAGLAKTRMAKSVLDAGWSDFKNQLAYKAVKHGAWFEEVNEAFSTQTCSGCGALPDSRPRGSAGLGIREWQCSDCGCLHDRDQNAALNILRCGRASLAVGIPGL
jgi:putative transposase